MKIEIRSRWSLSVLFSTEAVSLKVAIEEAAKRGANLGGADLRGADLRGADLYGADLREANLYKANLREANLREANLRWGNLYEANLGGANLCGANLYGANLRGADLYGADLRWGNLYEADLRGADLRGGILDPAGTPNGDVAAFTERDGDWVIGYRTRETSAAGKILQDDRIYGADVFSVADTECHPGWYLWPTLAESQRFSPSTPTGYVQVKARALDVHKAGAKWRARAIWVLGEVG